MNIVIGLFRTVRNGLMTSVLLGRDMGSNFPYESATKMVCILTDTEKRLLVSNDNVPVHV
jgi:hypothetical protein